MVPLRVYVLSDKIMIFILVKKIICYTGKSPLGAPLVQCDIEIELICPLSFNPLITSHGKQYRPLSYWLTVKAASLIFISSRGSANSYA